MCIMQRENRIADWLQQLGKRRAGGKKDERKRKSSGEASAPWRASGRFYCAPMEPGEGVGVASERESRIGEAGAACTHTSFEQPGSRLIYRFLVREAIFFSSSAAR